MILLHLLSGLSCSQTAQILYSHENRSVKSVVLCQVSANLCNRVPDLVITADFTNPKNPMVGRTLHENHCSLSVIMQVQNVSDMYQ